ncbi:hypothetical protein K1719_023100 [Acacia pycnantha]|nr:hypothetical protein K1719_023100 [Acacia pycnantha]
MYLHPDEEYHPSSVNWFFANGGLLYKKGNEPHPTPIRPNDTSLPQDPNNDSSYWLDLPADEDNKERVKRGYLQSSQAYMHIKPMFGGTFIDIACWVYYPFNGPARAKVENRGATVVSVRMKEVEGEKEEGEDDGGGEMEVGVDNNGGMAIGSDGKLEAGDYCGMESDEG